MRRDLLLRTIAYHVQEQAQGGLRPATRRRLARTAQDLSSERRPVAGPLTLKAGTRLLREWQGVIHEVIVLEEGAPSRPDMAIALDGGPRNHRRPLVRAAVLRP